MGFYWCPWCIVVLVVVNGVLVTLVGFISNIPMVFSWCIVVLVVVNGVLVTFFGRGCMTRWIQGTTRAIDPRSTLVIIIIFINPCHQLRHHFTVATIVNVNVHFFIIIISSKNYSIQWAPSNPYIKGVSGQFNGSQDHNTDSLKLFSRKIEIGIGVGIVYSV